MSIKLSRVNLDKLSKDIKVPNYKKENLSQGILHFGVGNFHRSHQALYMHKLFNKGLNHDWAIIGAGVMPNDEKMRELLLKQDYLTTIVEQSASNVTAEVTAAMIDYLSPNEPARIIETLADPKIKIVSLTITEGGYFINSATSLFDDKHPLIIEDSQNPNNPKTVFGLIIAGLKKRKELNIEPFTIMSCDNIPHNGDVTRNTLKGLAKLSDEAFSKWIIDNVSFPNAMVDRITPATANKEREYLKNNFNLDDSWPVFCEDFTQWVLEDDFSLGRPALEEVGVEFVDDVAPYEHMKIRILNGGHAIIAYSAGLLDIEYAYEAMENRLILEYFRKIQENEILPILPPVPNTDLYEYYKKIEERFSNPKIEDSIRRLCLDGSNRQPKFIIPSIADCLKANIDISGLALESALWCRYCYGSTESGAIIEANDPSWERLNKTAIKAKDNPQAWLDMEDIYGDVAKSEKFKEVFTLMLNSLWKNGVVKTIQAYLDEK